MTQINTVLFDLDGTLADTALDLGGALNTLLRARHLPEQPIEAVRPIAGLGSGALITLGFGIDAAHPEHEVLKQAFLNEYQHNFKRDTVLFEGVNELLTALVGKGYGWGIITNKHARFTDLLVPSLGFSERPGVVVSGDTTDEAKPSVKPMLYACHALGVAPEACVYVGDALRDIEAGRNAGMKTVLANWGYFTEAEQPEQWGADWRIDTALDLLRMV
ncbi:MAG: HAD family hydrolase [Neisseriaceae bacterium]|nr:HAD family hydrolase [Neisseriaceae bacterium]MBP6860834.1 HAD family hydrolase [Neisseriaceae bacterium]